MNSLEKLTASFDENFIGKDGKEQFQPLFDWMVNYVSQLEFQDCFVDIARDRIDMNIFRNGLSVTISQVIEPDERDIVMYSVSHNNVTLIISMMEINELIESIKKAMAINEEKAN